MDGEMRKIFRFGCLLIFLYSAEVRADENQDRYWEDIITRVQAGDKTASAQFFSDPYSRNVYNKCKSRKHTIQCVISAYSLMMSGLMLEAMGEPAQALNFYPLISTYYVNEKEVVDLSNQRQSDLKSGKFLTQSEAFTLFRAVGRSRGVRLAQFNAQEDARYAFLNGSAEAFAGVLGAIATNRTMPAQPPVTTQPVSPEPRVTVGAQVQAQNSVSSYQPPHQPQTNTIARSPASVSAPRYRDAGHCISRTTGNMGGKIVDAYLTNRCAVTVEIRACVDAAGADFACRSQGSFGGAWAIRPGATALVSGSAGKPLYWVACEAPGTAKNLRFSSATGLHADGCF
jgi:hypothetical protein